MAATRAAAAERGYLSAYRTGVPWKIPVTGDGAVAFVKDPLGIRHEVPVQDGRAALFGDRAGFYELSIGDDGQKSLFAANLTDPAESHIEPNKDLKLGGQTARPVEGFHAGVRRELWVYLIAALALLSVLEWFSYHRRITV